MSKVKLGTPSSYREAGDILLDSINLNNIQVRDYRNFFRNILPRQLAKPIISDKFELRFLDWYLDDAEVYSEEVCKSDNLSREMSLKAMAQIKLRDLGQGSKNPIYPDNTILTFPLEITKIPILSDTGSFLIKGVDRVMVSHLEEAATLVRKANKKGDKSVEFAKKSGAKFIIRMNKNVPRVEIVTGPSNINIGNNNTSMKRITSSLRALLSSMNIIEDDEIESILGVNPLIYGLATDGKNTAEDLLGKASKILISIEERALLNEKLSFRTRLSGRILAQDITAGELSLSKGDKVKPEDAEYLQQQGVSNVLVNIDGKTINIWNNSFVDPTQYVAQKDMIDNMIRWSTDGDIMSDEIKEMNGHYLISLTKLRRIEKEIEESPLELKEQLELNQESLLGSTLTKDDIVAILNIFSMYTLGMELEDDRDSLTNKSLVNISSVFNDLLISRLFGGVNDKNIALSFKIADKISEISTVGSAKTKLNLSSFNVADSETFASKLVKDPWQKLFQVESNVNPLDEINHKRKISLVNIQGRGGIQADRSDPKPRSVNNSHIGRICAIESPEGPKIGLVVHLASLAIINENGIIEAPFFKINHETNEIDYTVAHYMDYEEEQLYTRAIVPRISDRDFARVTLIQQGIAIDIIELQPKIGLINGKRGILNKSLLEQMAKDAFNSNEKADTYKLEIGMEDWFQDEIVDCFQGNGNLVKVGWDEIDYVTTSGEHILSAVTGNIPFAEYDDGTRLMMAASMSKQTEAIMGAQRPLIGTSLTDKIGSETNRVIISPIDGIVTQADIIGITIEEIKLDNSDLGQEPISKYFPLEHSIVTSEKSIINNVLNVKVGDIVQKGDVLADIETTENGHVKIGTNLLVGYMPYHSYNFEDAILISDRLIREDILTSYRATNYSFRFNPETDKNAIDHKEKAGHTDFISQKADNKGIIKVGTKVKPGDILAIKIVGEKSVSVLGYTGETEGIVVKVDELEGNSDKIITYDIVVSCKEKIHIGDKLAGKHGNKGVVSKILPAYKMPRTADGKILDIILTPLGIPSRMNIGQLLETQLGLILDEMGMRANYDSRNRINMPLTKKLLNEWTGDNEGKLQLYDGITGKPYLQKSTVGMVSFNKLKHQSGYSIYARGQGSPSEYTSNGHPTQGKKNGGGQRFGEMEMWALTAHGAVEVLKEIQTYKSDDVANRELFKKYLKNNDSVELQGISNIPKSYRMTMVQLMSKGMDIAHYDENDRELDIFKDWIGGKSARGASNTDKYTGPKFINRNSDKYTDLLNLTEDTSQTERTSQADTLVGELFGDLGLEDHIIKSTESADEIFASATEEDLVSMDKKKSNLSENTDKAIGGILDNVELIFEFENEDEEENEEIIEKDNSLGDDFINMFNLTDEEIENEGKRQADDFIRQTQEINDTEEDFEEFNVD